MLLPHFRAVPSIDGWLVEIGNAISDNTFIFASLFARLQQPTTVRLE